MKRTEGFALIQALLICLVVVVIGSVGAYAYHKQHKTNSSTVGSITSGSQARNRNTIPPPSTDPYAGWKSYTDSLHHYSFKYPADWTITTDTTQDVAVSIRNGVNSVLVSYANPFSKDSGVSAFSASDIQSVAGMPGLKVIGGAFTANNLPTYAVVDAAALQTYPLAIGKSASFPAAPRFSDVTSNDKVQFTAFPVGTAAARQQMWFDTSDAKTSLLILQSLTYQL